MLSSAVRQKLLVVQSQYAQFAYTNITNYVNNSKKTDYFRRMDIIQIILKKMSFPNLHPNPYTYPINSVLKNTHTENINHTPKALLHQASKLHSMMMHNYGTFKQHLRACHKQ